MDEPLWLYIKIFFTNCTSLTFELGWWYAKSNLFYFLRRHWNEFVSALSVFSCENAHRIDILGYDSCQCVLPYPWYSTHAPFNTPQLMGLTRYPLSPKHPSTILRKHYRCSRYFIGDDWIRFTSLLPVRIHVINIKWSHFTISSH